MKECEKPIQWTGPGLIPSKEQMKTILIAICKKCDDKNCNKRKE